MPSVKQRMTRISRSLLSSSQDRIVDFIICGTQKGGTSALDAYLREHPGICMADKKEVHFFDDESNFIGKPNYSHYHGFFNPKANRLVGEATPIYMYWYDCPRRIWLYKPSMKIIVILRNPIERAYSHWNMERMRQAEKLSFWDAIQNESTRCREALPFQHRVYSYVDRGFYLEQLRRLWFYFSRENVLVLKHEQLKSQPEPVLAEICRFLGVENFKGVEQKDVHSRQYASPMTDRERACLQSVYEHEIHGLERALNWDCSDWLAT